MGAFISQWAVSFMILALTILLVVSDYRIAVKRNKSGRTEFADRRRMRGMLMIGAALAGLAAFVQWSM